MPESDLHSQGTAVHACSLQATEWGEEEPEGEEVESWALLPGPRPQEQPFGSPVLGVRFLLGRPVGPTGIPATLSPRSRPAASFSPRFPFRLSVQRSAKQLLNGNGMNNKWK